jgi:hypothetical protein
MDKMTRHVRANERLQPSASEIPKPVVESAIEWLTRLAHTHPHRNALMLSTPVEHPTLPSGENPTDRRGDEPQFVEASCRARRRRAAGSGS